MKPLLQVSDASLDPKNITIKVCPDLAGRVHFRDAPLQSAAAARFSRLQEFALRRKLIAPTPAAQVGLCLVLFDGVATRDALACALAQLNSVFAWRNNYHIDWADSIGRTIRRTPSVFTRAALASPRLDHVDVEGALTALNDLLKASVRGLRKSYGLDLLLLDAQAWLAENLSNPLAAHCIGAITMASLPRSALAREATGLALPLPVDDEKAGSEIEGFSLAFEAYLNTTAIDRGSWLVDEITSICRREKLLSNEVDKKRMLKSCLALAQRANLAGPTSGLILGWVIDLLESGTRTKRKLKAITPAKYVASAAKRLLEAFRSKNIENLGIGEFVKIYESLLEGLSSSQARTLASALSSWHFFLTCWTDVEPIFKRLHKWFADAPPKANVLWPHEIMKCREWIDAANCDERFQGQLKLAFEILTSVRIRATELLTLRLCNFQFEGTTLRIEVATPAANGGTKTPAGRRNQFIQNQTLISLVRDWIARRLKDGALPIDYVFGDPYHPERQYQSGHLYLTLNRLIKAVTGDSTLATHVLSHTRISFDWAEAIRQPHLADINPIEQCSVASGHASATTGFVVYFHFPEEWLRGELDLAITKHLQTWPSAKNHVALSHAAFRQVRARLCSKGADASPGAVGIKFIERAAPSLIVRNTYIPWAMVYPTNPLHAKELGPLDLEGVLSLLHDCWHGHSPSAIALRCGRSEEIVTGYASLSLQVLRDIGELPHNSRDDRNTNPINALGSVLNGAVGQRIQIQRAGQDKTVHLYDFISSSLGRVTKNRFNDAMPLNEGVESWKLCYRKGYFSIERPQVAKGFITMLDAAEFPRHLIVLRGIATIDSAIDAGIESIFRSGVAVIPDGFEIKHRYGRPLAFLTLTSRAPSVDKNGKLPNAALGMSGVHALMLGAAVALAAHDRLLNSHTKLSENTGDNSNE